MKSISILSILQSQLIGKKLKTQVSGSQIYQDVNIPVKKNGATIKQFEGGNPRFRTTKTIRKHLGRMSTYETFEIVNVVVCPGNYDISEEFRIVLSNEMAVSLPLESELVEIEKEVYFIN